MLPSTTSKDKKPKIFVKIHRFSLQSGIFVVYCIGGNSICNQKAKVLIVKTAKHVENVMVDGFEEKFEFRVDASAKAFDILVGKVYSDPIKAIIRELSTNAADSHVDAGNPEKKFDIHLPNFAKPEFVIRDYGTGLDPTEMRDVYTVLFKSNKDHSNEFTGCLGLGSKSPFSYVKNFTIESWKNGRYYIYTAFKAKNGVPSLAVLDGNGVDTKEPNGIRITIPVKTEDFSNFKNKAESVFEYFDNPPNVTGQQINIKTHEYILNGYRWNLRESSFYGSGTKAIMGNIAYPIRCDDSSLTAAQKSLLECNLDISFDIGELDIDAGREALHFDDRTVRHVKVALQRVIDELQVKISDMLKNCISLWEARCQVKKIEKVIPNDVARAIDSSVISWNGELLDYGSYHRSINFHKIIGDNSKVFSFEKKWNGNIKRHKISAIAPSSEIKFYINDLKTGAYVRSMVLAEDNPNDFIILCSFTNKAIQDEFREKLGFLDSDWNFASSLPKSVRASKTVGSNKSKAKTAKVCKYTPSNLVSSCWENANIALGDSGYCVELNRYKVISNGKVRHPDIIRKLIKFLKSIDDPVANENVFGIKTSVLQKAKKIGNWVDIIEYAETKFLQEKNKFDATVHIANEKERNLACRGSDYLNVYDIKSISKHVDKDSDFLNYKESIDKLEVSDDDSTKSRLFNDVNMLLYGEVLPTSQPSYHITEIEEGVYEKYRLLGKLNIYDTFTDEDCVHIANYVNCVDSQEN